MRNLSNNRKMQLYKLQDSINYKFKDLKLLNKALTHSSYANEYKRHNIKYNERLEFLGDSVLGLVISDYLFTKYKNYPEGELTKIRALIVCEPSLASVSKRLNLGKYLLLGKGEESTGGRKRISILSDSIEALIGAIYIDSDIEVASEFILFQLRDIIDKAVNGNILLDYKTELQETIQKCNSSRIEYRVIKEEGPDHNKIFFVQVLNNDKVLGSGKGGSKKEAEQEAAKSALKEIGE